MKSKRNTYLLLLATVAIWSYIGYVIIANLGTDSNAGILPGKKQISSQVMAAPDTFSLKLNYRDPFLREPVKKAPPKVTTNIPPKKPIHQIKPHANIKWPDISFLGAIQNQATGVEIYMVRINNEDLIVRKGDKIREMTIVAVSATEITLNYQDQLKTVKK